MPVIMPADMMSEPARERLAIPSAGAVLARQPGLPPGHLLHRRGLYGTINRDNVKDKVTEKMNLFAAPDSTPGRRVPSRQTNRSDTRNTSTEDSMSQQFGSRGNDREQHQRLECLRCDLVAQPLSHTHAERDRQHGRRR